MASIIESIPIDLGGQRRHLRFDHESVMTAERELTRFWGRDYTFFEALQKLLDFLATGELAKLSMANLGILVWQGCRHEAPQLTLAQVQAAMPHIGDAAVIIALAGQVLGAWQVGSPPLEPDNEVEHETNPLDGSIGPRAGLSVVSTSD
jgi:hypothetical protein